MNQFENNYEDDVVEHKSSRKKIIFIGAILVLSGGLYALGYFGYFNSWFPTFSGWVSREQPWEAVFLNNNQVYFGRIRKNDKDVIVLTDVFYLRVQQPLQPSSQEPNVSLVKLGSELHGPEDIMYIPRNQITFWETMRKDSQVVQAIQNFLAQQ